MSESFDQACEGVLLALSGLPPHRSAKSYRDAIFAKAFPQMKSNISKGESKRSIVERLKGTSLEMSYATFIARYAAEEKMSRKRAKDK